MLRIHRRWFWGIVCGTGVTLTMLPASISRADEERPRTEGRDRAEEKRVNREEAERDARRREEEMRERMRHAEQERRAAESRRSSGPMPEGERGRGPSPYSERPGEDRRPTPPRPPRPPEGPERGKPHHPEMAGREAEIRGELLRERDPEMFELQQRDAELEAETTRRAHHLREAGGSEEERQHLRRMVMEHFEVRQRRREHELRRLEQQIDQLRNAMRTRSENREKIIEHRIRELMGKEDSGF